MTAVSTTRSSRPPQPTRPDGSALRVLAVDAEAWVRDLLSMSLRHEGWDVRVAATGSDALRIAQRYMPDVVVLDMMLPDMNALMALRRLHAISPGMPVVFLTAHGRRADGVAGLTAGGDDYVTKPFSMEELAARLRGLLRRTGRAIANDSLLVVGDLTLDEGSRQVTRGGEQIRLSAREFELLRYLMRNPRRVLSKSQILARVWDDSSTSSRNIVELYVSYLRRKIDKGRQPMIHTLRGVGYVLKPATP